MKLSNPACRKARKCQPFCGMCNLQEYEWVNLTAEELGLTEEELEALPLDAPERKKKKRVPKYRLITDKSLFGVCRTLGVCVCKNWSKTANCYWINGRNVSYKPVTAGTYDCLASEHPEHHKYNVASWELDEDKQSRYNKLAKQEHNDYKEIAGLYGGIYQWRKK